MKDLATKEPLAQQLSTATQESTRRKKVKITFDDVKKYICPEASSQEILLFLKVCESENLNPFAGEIYLVKDSEKQPAAIIIAIDAFIKAAESCEHFDGYQAGIILKGDSGQLEFREGSFILEEDQKRLVGGWARVYRKDRSRPFYSSVNISEYRKFTGEGKPTRFWEEMPATMIRKVGLSQALREAFPNRFAGTSTTSEADAIDGELRPAFTRCGEPDWPRFWVKVKEMGYTEQEVHRLLGIQSLKDWLSQGKTLGDAMTKLEEAKLTLSPEQEAPEEEIPAIDEKLWQCWGTARGKIKSLGLKEVQVANWFRKQGFGVGLKDFDPALPPEKFTPEVLSRFVDSLTLYEERRGKGKAP